MDEKKVVHKELSFKIIGILFEVYNNLGYGYQEKYYERAIEKYFKDRKIKFKRQALFNIAIKGEIIGRYYLDFLVEDKIVLEIKKGNHFSKQNISFAKSMFRLCEEVLRRGNLKRTSTSLRRKLVLKLTVAISSETTSDYLVETIKERDRHVISEYRNYSRRHAINYGAFIHKK